MGFKTAVVLLMPEGQTWFRFLWYDAISFPSSMIKINKLQGEVFRAHNVLTNEVVAIKLSPANDVASMLHNEYDILYELQGITGIPCTILFESGSSYNTIIFECLGPSLEEAFESCHQFFSLDTISMIGGQLVCQLIVIEISHNSSCSFVDCRTFTPVASFIGISSPATFSSTLVLQNCTGIRLHTAIVLLKSVVAHWAVPRSLPSIVTLDLNWEGGMTLSHLSMFFGIS